MASKQEMRRWFTTRSAAPSAAAHQDAAVGTCSMSNPSLDVMLEGVAKAITESALTQELAETYRSVLGWPLEVRGDGLHGPNAPTAGPPPTGSTA